MHSSLMCWFEIGSPTQVLLVCTIGCFFLHRLFRNRLVKIFIEPFSILNVVCDFQLDWTTLAPPRGHPLFSALITIADTSENELFCFKLRIFLLILLLLSVFRSDNYFCVEWAWSWSCSLKNKKTTPKKTFSSKFYSRYERLMFMYCTWNRQRLNDVTITKLISNIEPFPF